MGLYTVPAVLSVAVVVAVELAWLRTLLFRRVSFWVAYAICLFFQVLVDGWLTKLSAPIVLYDEDAGSPPGHRVAGVRTRGETLQTGSFGPLTFQARARLPRTRAEPTTPSRK